MNRRSGPRELQPHQQREHAAQRQEDEGGRDVAPADALVVHRGEHAPQRRRRSPDTLELPVQDLRRKLGVAHVRRDQRAPARAASARITCSSASQADTARSCVRRHRHHRHVVAWLDRLRIGDPGGERSARRRQQPGGDRAAGSPTWVRSGPSVPAALVPRTV